MRTNTWDKIEYFQDFWELRVKMMSNYITGHHRKVCDIGCGESKLKQYLAVSHEYIGIDYKQRDNVTLVCDLNNREFPFPEMVDDIVFCSGVFEYLYDIQKFIEYITKFAQTIIFSYCSIDRYSNLSDRNAKGWVNAFTNNEIKGFFLEKGYVLRGENTIFRNSVFCFDNHQKPVQRGKKLLVVDPIFRGSRAFYSSNAFNIGGLETFDLITRTHSIDKHTIQHFKNSSIPFGIFESVVLDESFWYGKLDDEKIHTLIIEVNKLYQEKKYDLIYFVGLDEIYPKVFNKLIGLTVIQLKNVNMLFVEYNYNHLISLIAYRKHFKAKLEFQKSFLKEYPKAKIAVLDERIVDKRFSVLENSDFKGRYIFMSDPASMIYPRKQLKWKDKKSILLVGLQSKRKGINNFVNFLKKYEKFLFNVQFILVGRLDNDSEIHREYLKNCSVLQWIDTYIEEEVLQEMYSEADYIMLPYTMEFNGSSGVFAHACSHAKPVIATSHGCIGFRVNEFKLGKTFKSGNYVEMFNVIQQACSINFTEYQEMVKHAYQYALNNSMEAHQKIILQGLNEWK